MITFDFMISDIAQAALWQTVRGADAALGADEGVDVADRLGVRIVVEIGDRLHELQRRDRLDQVFADAALQQIAIEHDVVGVPDHDDLGAGVAALGQAVELGDDLLARQLLSMMMRFGVGFCGSASLPPRCRHVHADVRLGEPPVLRGAICMISAMAAFSQKAWIEMRGIGRAWTRPGPPRHRGRGRPAPTALGILIG